MATTKTKPELVRMGWLTEMRRQGHRQCHGAMKRGQRVCAFGLLEEVVGRPMWLSEEVMAEAGLTLNQIGDVIALNDGDKFAVPEIRKHTFAEIAEVVESWFSK